MKSKRLEGWTAEEKLKVLLEYDKLDEEQRGKYLREKGLHSISSTEMAAGVYRSLCLQEKENQRRGSEAKTDQGVGEGA